jgi:uncharacterized protein YrzB (UPF0473 family)
MSEKNHDDIEEFQNDEVITLIDEESGIPRSFYIIDVFESEGNRYAALQSLEEDDIFDEDEDADEENSDFEPEDIPLMEEGEMLLLRMEESDDGEVLVGIDDDNEFERVRTIFESRLESEDED